MNEEELAQIEARLEAASPGPWTAAQNGKPADVVRATIHDDLGIAQAVTYDWERTPPGQAEANGEFIAHAREDIPVLIAEVRRLKAKVSY